MTLAVHCKDLKKTYGHSMTSVEALRGINLEIAQGELVMVVGPSGSGKTTLISVISSLLHQDGGECLVYGENLSQRDEAFKTAFRGQHIGFVFQLFNLIPMLSGIENVSIPLLLNGIPEEQAFKKAAALLEQVGLVDRMHALPPEMSGGEQQRVAIARSCIHNPKLIVCDEPTSALDHETGLKVLSLLKEVSKKTECALIIVTHDSRIFHFADRILHMDDGRII